MSGRLPQAVGVSSVLELDDVSVGADVFEAVEEVEQEARGDGAATTTGRGVGITAAGFHHNIRDDAQGDEERRGRGLARLW